MGRRWVQDERGRGGGGGAHGGDGAEGDCQFAFDLVFEELEGGRGGGGECLKWRVFVAQGGGGCGVVPWGAS